MLHFHTLKCGSEKWGEKKQFKTQPKINNYDSDVLKANKLSFLLLFFYSNRN